MRNTRAIIILNLMLMLGPSFTGAQNCVDPPSGLISWWPGDIDASDIKGGNNGILQNGTTIAVGYVDQAFSFDGVDDAISMGDVLDFALTPFTVDAWVRRSPSSGSMRVVGTFVTGSPGWDFSIRSNGQLILFLSGDGSANSLLQSVSSEAVPDDGLFHHISAAIDRANNDINLYIDGFETTYLEENTLVNFGAMTDISSSTALTVGRRTDGLNPFVGQIDELAIYDRALSSAEIRAIFAAGSAGKCKVPPIGSVAGQVTADCPAVNTSLFGVDIDAFQVGTGDLLGTALTDANGNYQINDLAAGDYSITIVTPLGYTAASVDEIGVTVTAGGITAADFSLSCVAITTNPRAGGFWKHQVGVVTGGKGNAQIDATTLCNYLDLIEVHFNTNEINQVIIYVPPASGVCADKLQVAKELLNLKGNVTMTSRAKQKLTALLLNVAAGYISQPEIISADGATVSQAITYCDNLIDDSSGDHEKAKTICDDINMNIQVATGVIPLSTVNIAYRNVIRPDEYDLLQNYPNPFNPATEIIFHLPVAGQVILEVYNINGQKVTTLLNGKLESGFHTVTFDGSAVASGIYFYRLTAGEYIDTKKMLLLK